MFVMTATLGAEKNSARGARKRGRPRSTEAVDRILTAALEEYAERGWSGFTLEAVARRAGVGKSTIYLRWKDREGLLTDAVRARSESLESIDTGNLRSDLEALSAGLLRYYLDPIGFATFRVAVDAAGATQPLGDFTGEVVSTHRTAAVAILKRAAARGEVPPDAPIQTMILCLYGGVTMEMLTLAPEERTLTDEQIAARTAPIVDLVLKALS